MALCFGHFVVAVLFPTDVHLCMGKPGLGIDFERRERVGNRRGGDFRGLGLVWLRGCRLALGFICGRLHSEYPRWRLPDL